jgi:predicted HAD superfamily phosphohydrolase YqeG
MENLAIYEAFRAVPEGALKTITGGNLAGIVTLLVDPIEPEDGPFFKLKRRLEKPLLKHFDRKHGKQEG